MSQEDNEIEGVRILGASEAKEVARTSTTSKSKDKDKKVVTAPVEQTTNVELPHWSEAPTGEVPAAVVDDENLADGWEALTGSQPRIRVDQNDWKEVDYDPSLNLKDDAISVGALGNDHISLEDSEEEFQKSVAQKRTENAANSDRVTKISTVPDTASASPIEGEALAEPKGASKVKAHSKAKREKRPGVAPYSNSEEAKESQESQTSNLIARTLTGLGIAAVALICFYLGAIPTLVFASLLIGAMSIELCGAFRKIGAKPAALLVAIMAFFSVVGGYLIGDRVISVSAVVFFFFAALWYLFDIVKARPVIGLAISSLVFGYVGIFGSFAGIILKLQDANGKSVGVYVLASVVLCVIANDTAAYITGKLMGRTPLVPNISPNKTWEGLTAGFVASIFVGVLIATIPSNSIWQFKGGIALGALVACAAVFGDLIESMLKRDCDLKDFGSLLPGHGGLMDRFDALLIALPVAYFLALALI
ncbi:MAG: phosphatidate cytidylyltransferase [Acidimicrobiia bacterium]